MGEAQCEPVTINGATYIITRDYVGKKPIKELLAEQIAIASATESIAFDSKADFTV